MKLFNFLFLGLFTMATPCFADGLFSEQEQIQDGIPVIEASETFADIYEKLDSVRWGGKNINIAIESLENINPHAHIAATDERVVLVWRDTIIANYPRPRAGDWRAFGEITTALILKLRANDTEFRQLGLSEMYQRVVDGLMRGIDENGKYIYSRAAERDEDNRFLTSVGMTGARDARGNWRVTGIFKGAPADIAGISDGDLIVQINGQDVADMSDADLDSVMTGFNSGTAKIKLATPMGNKDVVLRRATMVLADADIVHRAAKGDNGAILEIIVHRVSDAAVSIVREAISTHPDVTGIILDLRAASGTDERAGARLGGLFVGDVPVMRIVQTAHDELEVVPSSDAITDANMVVLTSNQTRGTAEAIASAIYENGRGVIVGTPTAGQSRIATRIDLKNGGALELLNKSINTGSGRAIDGRGVFPIVCLSNIRSSQQQNAFFLNVVNNDFDARDFNKEDDIDVDAVRRGCPSITNGNDEDALASAVAAKILTDTGVYKKLVAE